MILIILAGHEQNLSVSLNIHAFCTPYVLFTVLIFKHFRAQLEKIKTEFINDNNYEYEILQGTIYIMQIRKLITNLERQR